MTLIVDKIRRYSTLEEEARVQTKARKCQELEECLTVQSGSPTTKELFSDVSRLSASVAGFLPLSLSMT